MDTKTFITLLTTVFIAFVGYLVSYFNSIKLSQRKERLDRIDRQLREFYGPIYSLLKVSEVAWNSFRSIYRPGGAFWGTTKPPSDEEAEAWRRWMKEVFMPINLQIQKIITDHSELIDEEEFPKCLLLLSAHITAYKPVLAAWENNDFSNHVSVINFPRDEVVAYIDNNYRELKRIQSELIRKLPNPPLKTDRRTV
jgi:hypothetical protein